MKAIGSEYNTMDVIPKPKVRARWNEFDEDKDNHPHSRMYVDIKSTELPNVLTSAFFHAVPNAGLMEWKRMDKDLACYITIDDNKQSAYISFKYHDSRPSAVVPCGTVMNEAMWTALMYNGASVSDVLVMPWPDDEEDEI